MIYFLSDFHGERFDALEEYAKNYKDGDLLIVLGDVGLRFENTEENRIFTEYFLSIDKPIAIVEGNHENHAYLNSFPEEFWHGGKVNRLSKNIVRLCRGNIFEIDGKSFFVMGGCKSSAKWKEMGLWFEGENPSEAEVSLAYENLKKRGNRVDYILTHKYSPEMHSDNPLTLEGLVNFIENNVSFSHWYAGHWHTERFYDDRHTIVYNRLYPLK